MLRQLRVFHPAFNAQADYQERDASNYKQLLYPCAWINPEWTDHISTIFCVTSKFPTALQSRSYCAWGDVAIGNGLCHQWPRKRLSLPPPMTSITRRTPLQYFGSTGPCLTPIRQATTTTYGEMLEFVREESLRMLSHKPNYLFVIGDQQTYERMIHLKNNYPDLFWWLIPIPGEFHVCAHMLECIYHLFWTQLFKDLRAPMNRAHITEFKLIETFNTHEEFALVVCAGVMDFLEGILGSQIWVDLKATKQMLQKNYTAAMLYSFCVDYMFPYVRFRMLLRLKPSPERRKELNKFYYYFMPRFRTANKFKYAILCVDFMYTYERMHSALRDVFDNMYTGTWRAYEGHWMPIDQIMEKSTRRRKHWSKEYLPEAGSSQLCSRSTIFGLLNELMQVLPTWETIQSMMTTEPAFKTTSTLWSACLVPADLRLHATLQFFLASTSSAETILPMHEYYPNAEVWRTNQDLDAYLAEKTAPRRW